MPLDFTLDKYRELCESALNYQYAILTVQTYLTMQNPPAKFIILRHDVDRKPWKAVRMAEIEKQLGIRATYYFRFNKKVFQPHLIRQIANMEHELGYHYEVLDKAKGNYAKAIQLFERELGEFRRVVEVKTICMHGNPLTKWDNRDLWKEYDFTNYGLIGEAYLFSCENVIYLSDTGGTWSNKHKVKDIIAHNTSSCTSMRSTDDLITSIRKGEAGKIYILAHPNRWSSSSLGWLESKLSDVMANAGKSAFSYILPRLIH